MLMILTYYPLTITLFYLVYLNILRYSSNVSSKNEECVFFFKNYNYVNLNSLLVYLAFYVFILFNTYNFYSLPHFIPSFNLVFFKLTLLSFILFNVIFRKDFNTQASLSFILISMLFCLTLNDYLVTLVFFEIVFYTYLYTLTFSLMYATKSLKSNKTSSLMFPLIILNFYSTWVFCIFILYYLYELGCTSCTYSLFTSKKLSTLYFIFILFKVNLGPWFFKFLPLYRFLSNKSLLVYIIIYFFCIVPVLYLNAPILFNYTTFLPVVFILYYLHFFDFFLVKSTKYILMYSSFVTYYYILFLLITP